ncbi:MAG: N-acetyltransferase [Candidatus Bathyarchaeota archaeon]|nr:N-acetyltransferase [Candidatus Bathyarchaeota archaeon]
MGKKAKIVAEAYVDGEAKIGHNVSIGRFAEVLSGSVIGDHCIIGSRCIIGHPSKLELQKVDFSAASPKVSDLIVTEPVTRIGAGAIIRSGSIIYRHVVIGEKLRTGHSILVREHVTLGDNCVVGTNAVLDGYIRVGSNSMIQSNCYITQSTRIGNGVFISPGCAFFDNRRIVLGEGLERTTISDYVRIGGGTTILPGITIGRYALVGAGSVVTKDVPPKVIAYGVPAEVKGFQTDEELQKYVDSIETWQ